MEQNDSNKCVKQRYLDWLVLLEQRTIFSALPNNFSNKVEKYSKISFGWTGPSI